MFTWTAEVCPKTGNVTSLNMLQGSRIRMKEPVVVRGAKVTSVIVSAKDIMLAHKKCIDATKQMTMYEGI